VLPPVPGILGISFAGRLTHLAVVPNLQRRAIKTLARLQNRGETLQNEGEKGPFLALQSWPTHSKLESSLLLHALTKAAFPDDYLRRLHLRSPWFVGLLVRDQFPRLLVSNHLSSGCIPVLGPFLSRETASLYSESVERRFLLRRCTETLHPHPQHPGCIYGEIKQCLRPCQCAVDETEYANEASRVAALLNEVPGKLARNLARQRDQAVAALEFETASDLHKQLEEIKGLNALRDPMITDISRLNGLVVVAGYQRSLVQIFRISEGRWDSHLTLSQEELIPSALDRWLLDGPDVESRSVSEDLALFSRWYYSTWREGAWIPDEGTGKPLFKKAIKAATKLFSVQQVGQGE
jgi:excinuclease ABC subunit C